MEIKIPWVHSLGYYAMEYCVWLKQLRLRAFQGRIRLETSAHAVLQLFKTKENERERINGT